MDNHHNHNLSGLEPGLNLTTPDAISGSEPALGGDRRIDPQILDELSAGKWIAIERLRRAKGGLSIEERSRYAHALIGRLEIIDPQQRRPLARDECAPILRILGVLGDRVALPYLISGLRSENSAVKRAAAQGLGQIGHPDGIPALLDTLGEYRNDRTSINPFVVVDALGRLGASKPDAVVPALLDLLESDAWPDLKLCALNALSRTADMRSLELLNEILRTHWDFRHRREAARALAQIQHESVLATLIEALTDRYRDVRYAVATALGNIGDPQATVPLQIAHANEPVRRVRICMERALKQLNAAPVRPDDPVPVHWFGDYWYPES